MDLEVDLLSNELMEIIKRYISETDVPYNQIINSTAVEILKQIQQVLIDCQLSDFERIEKIVCIFKEHHIFCGVCHDFG